MYSTLLMVYRETLTLRNALCRLTGSHYLLHWSNRFARAANEMHVTRYSYA